MTYTPRTEAFDTVAATPLGMLTTTLARTITQTVAIPGLTNTKTGEPLTVDRSYTIDEVDNEWVSVIVDYEFGDAPVIYGNHPNAIAPLREILPHHPQYAQADYPATARSAARILDAKVLRPRDMGGWATTPNGGENRVVEVELPWAARAGGAWDERRYFHAVREYLPFKADIWYDEARHTIVIRPPHVTEEEPRVSTS